MEEHSLIIHRKARYYLSGPLHESYSSICFVLHGYGQLAKYFIRPFCDEELSKVLFVAPEGFHRFYLKGTGGRVGASWMTKEDRLADIEDYVNYLDQVYDLFQHKIEETGSVGILGFSQGVATACRWLTFSEKRFDYLVNYAGAFPPDLPHDRAIERMKKIPVQVLAGTEDEYISEERFQQHLEDLKKQGFEVNARRFEGTHKIYSPEVKRSLQQVTNL